MREISYCTAPDVLLAYSELTDKDKAKYLLVPSPDVEKWMKVFGHAKNAKPAGGAPKAVQFGAPTVHNLSQGQGQQQPNNASQSMPLFPALVSFISFLSLDNGRPVSAQMQSPVVDNRRSMASTTPPIGTFSFIFDVADLFLISLLVFSVSECSPIRPCAIPTHRIPHTCP